MKSVSVELFRDIDEHVTHCEINLSDVRASDGVRISYDFDRDGWKIEQPMLHSWPSDDPVCDPQWTEVAFVQSWQLPQAPPLESREE